ncbi:MAG TPA: chitobiase/beta-hexosaminidase C-terminal domain-containing protein, partial [Nitrososphaera sp.]
GQDDDDVNENNGSEGESAPLQHILTIKAEDLSGESISVYMTIKSTNGTSLQTGSTPLTFSGTNLTYDITAADYDDARFDHWENGAASLTRQLTLSQDTTIVAYYNTSDTKSDTTAPTVTATPAGGTFTSVQSVTLTASEPAAIYYTISGNTPTTSSTVYSSPITITSMTTLKYFAKDAAGNSGSVATQTYTINAGDTTDPSVEITNFDDGSTIAMPAGGLITVHGTASDNQGGSGIEVVEVRVDDGNYVVATPTIQGDWSSWSVTLEVTAGERRLVPRATDNAGNQAWGSIYVTFTEPSGGGDNGGGDNGSLDDFGIEKLYPTVNGGNEWYVNMDDPYSDPLLQNRETLTEQPDGSWQVSGGSNGQVRLEAWSPANEKWLNVEITMYAKMVSGSNELLQMYSRGGHHTSSNECLGSAYKARFYGDGDAAWVKEVNHPASAGNRGSVQATNTPLADRWIGLKAVIYNFVENGKTYVRLESYIDDDVTDSSGNLVVGNNWELASVVEDRGGWASKDSDFNPTCAPVNKDSTQQYRQRDEIINMSGGTSTQNIAAFRSDNLTWNWKYLSVREIAPPS